MNSQLKDSFHFVEEIIDWQHDLFLGCFDLDPVFTNIPLEETIAICTNQLFQESETTDMNRDNTSASWNDKLDL